MSMIPGLDPFMKQPGRVKIWLALAVGAMAISLLYALILVLARSGFTPGFDGGEEGFKTALVLHVDFSLFVWFMAFAALFWDGLSPVSGTPCRHWLGSATAVVGATLMALSPLFERGPPIMSDYLPVIDHPLFLFACSLFFFGILISALRLLWEGGWRNRAISGAETALYGSALITLLAATTFGVALATLPEGVTTLVAYEHLFWGAGHLLQLNHLLLMYLALLLLLNHLGIDAGFSVRSQRTLIALVVLLALPGPLFTLWLPVDERGHIGIFTHMMAIGGLVGMALIGRLVLPLWHPRLSTDEGHRTLLSLLRSVLLLFVVGSLLGVLITDNDAMVPAHYHGVIGAVTLSYMGVGYLLMDRLSGRRLAGRLFRWQPRIYTSGVVLLMAGLLIADIPRKSLGVDGGALLGRSLTGIGGLLALCGSLLFVILLFRGVDWRRPMKAFSIIECNGRRG